VRAVSILCECIPIIFLNLLLISEQLKSESTKTTNVGMAELVKKCSLYIVGQRNYVNKVCILTIQISMLFHILVGAEIAKIQIKKPAIK